MAAAPFEKWEGLGNDFIVITVPSLVAFDKAKAARMCDRHLGIGADGVLLVLPAERGAARMKVINADGSVPEMCGNGIRCVALHVAEQRGMKQGEVVIETDAGFRACMVEREGDTGVVDVDMGVVRALGPRTLTVKGVRVEMTLADAGNPHAILYRDDPERDLAELGPPLAEDASFPQGTNVELVRWQGDVLEVHVWERGVGRTRACGTGACAVAAVACARGEGKAGEPVRVRLPGGELVILHDPATGQTRMKGPARRVFRGDWQGG